MARSELNCINVCTHAEPKVPEMEPDLSFHGPDHIRIRRAGLSGYVGNVFRLVYGFTVCPDRVRSASSLNGATLLRF